MKVYLATALALGLSATPLIPNSKAVADDASSYREQVCYKTYEYDKDSYTRIVLDVKLHSNLPTSYYGGKQIVYDAEGKHSYLENYYSRMAVVTGAVVTSSGSGYGYYGVQSGSHMGLTSIFVRGAASPAPQGGTTAPIAWDCSSSEISPTPAKWSCSIRLDASGQTLPATLYRLDYPDQYCDVFQDQ